jgi:hypothetical protein
VKRPLIELGRKQISQAALDVFNHQAKVILSILCEYAGVANRVAYRAENRNPSECATLRTTISGFVFFCRTLPMSQERRAGGKRSATASQVRYHVWFLPAFESFPSSCSFWAAQRMSYCHV